MIYHKVDLKYLASSQIEKLKKGLVLPVLDPPEVKKRRLVITAGQDEKKECCHLKLDIEDRMVIEQHKRLNDRHIYFAQALLLSQYPDTEGLCCTLLQERVRLDCSKK